VPGCTACSAVARARYHVAWLWRAGGSVLRPAPRRRDAVPTHVATQEPMKKPKQLKAAKKKQNKSSLRCSLNRSASIARCWSAAGLVVRAGAVA